MQNAECKMHNRHHSLVSSFCMDRSAFTLVELMVAIALVLILMLGVSQVFRMSSATVATQQAISDNVRVARAAQGVFARDFENAVVGNDAPFFVIHSSRTGAFRNRADDLADLHVNTFKSSHELSVDLDGNNVESEAAIPGERISAATYNFRSHRTDTLTFFTRELQKRQTGNPNQNFISAMTKSEAMVKYGHLRVWDGIGLSSSAGAYHEPGQDSFAVNPTNKYGAQFVLGRSAILLSAMTDTDGDGVGDTITDNTGAPQKHIAGGAGTVPILGQGSTMNTGGELIQESVIDIAGVTIQQMRQLMLGYIGTTTDWGRGFSYRMLGNPFMPRPVTAQTVAQTAPVLIPGCTQFIVEYAGDFLAQDNNPASPTYGQITNVYWQVDPLTVPATDGRVDYIADWNDVNNNGSIDPAEFASVQKRVRWYGMPREVTGDNEVRGGATPTVAARPRDVVPLRDVVSWGSTSAVTGVPASLKTRMAAAPSAPFEPSIALAAPAASPPPMKANYTALTGSNGADGMGSNDEYVVSFGPNDPKPKMIRITIVIDDPSGRLGNRDGQTFEYVYELP